MTKTKRRIISLFLIIVLALSLSFQTLMTTAEASSDKSIEKTSTTTNFFSNLLKVVSPEGQPLEKKTPEKITLGVSGQAAGGPTIKPRAGETINTGNYLLSNLNTNGEANGKIDDNALNYDFLSAFDLEYTSTLNGGGFYINLFNMDFSSAGSQSYGDISAMEGKEVPGIKLSDIFTAPNVKLENNSYFLQFQYKKGFTEHTEAIFITFDSITPTINSHDTVNPTSLTGTSKYGHPDNNGSSTTAGNSKIIEQTWVVTGPNGYSETVTGADIDSLLVYVGANKMPEGDYTVALKGTGTTINRDTGGGDTSTAIPDDYIQEVDSSFKVVYPKPIIKIDSVADPTNIPKHPESITVEGKLTGSDLKWEIKKANGDPLGTPVIGTSAGTGTAPQTITPTDYKKLPPDIYTMWVKETSTDNLTAETAVKFEILPPLPTSIVDRPENPKLGTGTKQLPDSDSTITWEILDKSGNPLDTPIKGTGLNVADTVFKSLPVGDYKLEFIETSTYNTALTATDTADFKIVPPLTSSKVDNATNPTTGTGTRQFPDGDSTITWEILDKSGNPLSTPIKGTGLKVADTVFKSLDEGEYKLQFTETSLYNNAIDKKDTPFKILNPLTSSAVNNIKNPTTGTGTQKMPAAESNVTWEILDKSGNPLPTPIKGTGLNVADTVFKGLTNGDYKLQFTETSLYNGKIDKKDTPFTINVPAPEVPLTTTTVTGTKTPTGNIYNPSTIAGTQNISSSSLTWEVKDSTGKVVGSGSGKDVPKSVIDALVEGSYTVNFTEKALNGKSHTSTGNFTIVKPDPTPTVDRPVNPNSITAVPNIPDSTLTWEIHDSNGKVVVTGNGGTVPPSILNNLAPGVYETVFTEHSLVPNLTAENKVTFSITKSPTTPIRPDGSGGSGGSRNPSTSNRVDTDSASTTSLPGSGKTPESIGSLPSPVSGDTKNNKKATNPGALNPQTSDATNEQLIIRAFYIVGIVSAVVLLLNLIIPKKKSKRD